MAGLVSHGGGDESLKTALNYPLTAGDWKSEMGVSELILRCQQICAPSGDSRGQSVPLALLVSRGGLHSLACGPITPTSASFDKPPPL